MRIVSRTVFSSIVATTVAMAGCTLDPLVSDEPGASAHILAPGTVVPHVSADLDLTRQIRVNDGLSDSALEESMGVLPLKSGWAAGQAVQYWDFGTAPEVGAAMYVFVTKNSDETVTPIQHPWLAAALPGDQGYSPFWFIQYVPVTAAYQGEIFPDVRSIADGVELGLLEEPYPAQLYMDGPIVAAGTKLDIGGGATKSTMQVIARGYMVDLFALGGAQPWKAMTKPGRLVRGDVSLITEGNSAVANKAPLFQNLSTPWTPAVRVINCRITASDPNDSSTQIHDEAQLFSRDMMGGLAAGTARVTTWTTTLVTKNWPILTP
jgi:hypothetical protein